MIRFTAKLADGKKQKLQAKSSWSELTYNELLKIEKHSKNLNPLMLFSILTGVKFDDINQSKDDKIIEMLMSVTGFIYDTPKWKDIKCPKQLMIGEKLYNVPMDINDIVNGQKVLLTQLTVNENNLEIIPRAVAIMMIPSYYGSFDLETIKYVDKLEQKILESNALQVYGVGQFFFLNLPILSLIGKNNLTQSQSKKKKMEPVH